MDMEKKPTLIIMCGSTGSEKDLTIQKLFDLGFLNTSSIPDSAAYLLSEEGKAKKIEEIPSSETGSISYLISLGLYPYDVAAQTMLRGTINLQKMDEDDNLINLYASVIELSKMAYIDEVDAPNINLNTLPIMTGVRKVETTDENGNITKTMYLSGYKGLVPTPTENDYGKVLFSDGSWRSITDIAINIGDGFSGLATDNEGAVFNDYAEYRTLKDPIESYEPGYCMTCNRDGKLFRTSSRMQHCEGITSDTFGFSIGRTDEATVPLAVAGRVLVYTSEDPSTYYTGQAVCASKGGRVSKMTDAEIAQNPDRIVGIVSEIPTYETWGTNNIKVNGRIWITVK